jgi:hypothetical protein
MLKEQGWVVGDREKIIVEVDTKQSDFRSQNQAQVKSLSHGGTMDIINIGIVKQLLFQVPPLPLQQKFARLVEKVEAMHQSPN